MKRKDKEKIIEAFNYLCAAKEEPTGESLIPMGYPISREDWETLLPFLRSDVKISQKVGAYDLTTEFKMPCGMLQVGDKCFVTIPRDEYGLVMSLIRDAAQHVVNSRHFAKALIYSTEVLDKC